MKYTNDFVFVALQLRFQEIIPLNARNMLRPEDSGQHRSGRTLVIKPWTLTQAPPVELILLHAVQVT